jgi:hypothetical protein
LPSGGSLLPRATFVLMFDLHRSGLSMGNQTLAHDEPRELLGVHEDAAFEGSAPGRITVLGNSLGAATVIEAVDPKILGRAHRRLGPP